MTRGWWPVARAPGGLGACPLPPGNVLPHHREPCARGFKNIHIASASGLTELFLLSLRLLRVCSVKEGLTLLLLGQGSLVAAALCPWVELLELDLVRSDFN